MSQPFFPSKAMKKRHAVVSRGSTPNVKFQLKTLGSCCPGTPTKTGKSKSRTGASSQGWGRTPPRGSNKKNSRERQWCATPQLVKSSLRGKLKGLSMTPGPKSALSAFEEEVSAKERSVNAVFINRGVVGTGSFCEVFKVRRKSDFRVFAIKRATEPLNTQQAAHLALNEIRVMRALQRERQHEHVVRFHAHWICGARRLHQLYDFAAHGTLLEVAQRNDKMNPRQLLQCVSQLLDGVAFVHSQRVLHLDLKPSNIFVGADFCLKLGDFGIAVDLDAAEADGSSKIYFSGDPIYIAPELLGFGRSLDDVGSEADIFSLGIIALELLYHISVPSQGPIFEALRHFSDCESFEKLVGIEEEQVPLDRRDVNRSIRALIAHLLPRESKVRLTAVQSLYQVRRLLTNKFVQSLPGLDAISLEPTKPAATPPATPSLHSGADPEEERPAAMPTEAHESQTSLQCHGRKRRLCRSASGFLNDFVTPEPRRHPASDSPLEFVQCSPPRGACFVSPPKQSPESPVTPSKSKDDGQPLRPFDSLEKKPRSLEKTPKEFSSGRSRKQERRSRKTPDHGKSPTASCSGSPGAMWLPLSPSLSPPLKQIDNGRHAGDNDVDAKSESPESSSFGAPLFARSNGSMPSPSADDDEAADGLRLPFDEEHFCTHLSFASAEDGDDRKSSGESKRSTRRRKLVF